MRYLVRRFVIAFIFASCAACVADAPVSTTDDGGAAVSDTGTAPSGTTVLAGEMTIEESVRTNVAGKAEAFQVVATASGPAVSFHVYLDGANTAATIAVGVYSDTMDNPVNLLGQGTITNAIAPGWNVCTLQMSTPIVQGTPYWFAMLSPASPGGAIHVRFNLKGPRPGVYNAVEGLSVLPAMWNPGMADSYASPISGYLSN